MVFVSPIISEKKRCTRPFDAFSKFRPEATVVSPKLSNFSRYFSCSLEGNELLIALPMDLRQAAFKLETRGLRSRFELKNFNVDLIANSIDFTGVFNAASKPLSVIWLEGPSTPPKITESTVGPVRFLIDTFNFLGPSSREASNVSRQRC